MEMLDKQEVVTEWENEEEDTPQRKQHRWLKGQSGNPAGRPKGKTMKEWVRETLELLTDEERIQFLEGIPKEIVWKMAEGNPHTTEDKHITVKVPTPILGGASNAHNLPPGEVVETHVETAKHE